MLAAADAALDLLVLELGLELLLLVAVLLGVLAPVNTRAEEYVLANRRRVRCRARAIFRAQAELGPCLAVGHPRVDSLLLGNISDAARRLDLLAVLVDAV